MRAQGARPAVLRVHELAALGMAGGSEERRSLLGVLRMVAAAGGGGDLRLRALGGHAARAPVARRSRLRWRRSWATGCGWARSSPRSTSHPAASPSRWPAARTLRAAAVVCALPVGPLRDVAVTGVSDARLASLHRQRQALAAKVVAAYPRAGLARGGRATGSRDGEGVDRLHLAAGKRRALACWSARSGSATSSPRRRACAARRCSRAWRDLYGPAAREPDAYLERALGRRPATRRATSRSGRRAT